MKGTFTDLVPKSGFTYCCMVQQSQTVNNHRLDGAKTLQFLWDNLPFPQLVVKSPDFWLPPTVQVGRGEVRTGPRGVGVLKVFLFGTKQLFSESNPGKKF